MIGRSQEGTFNALKAIRQRTPFSWLGIDSDNDSIFINHRLYRYCKQEGLDFTCLRPSRKNDNAYIQQKNYIHIRSPLGYLRYDTEQEQDIINDLYRNELRLYKNFFQPVMKLIKKDRIDGRLKRVYDTPQTPYQRLIRSGQLSSEQKHRLSNLYLSLNPVELKKAIYEKSLIVFIISIRGKRRRQ